MVHDVTLSLVMVHDVTLSLVMVDDVTLSLGMVDDVTLSLVMVHDVTLSLVMVHDVTLSLVMVHDVTLSLVMVHDVTLSLGVGVPSMVEWNVRHDVRQSQTDTPPEGVNGVLTLRPLDVGRDLDDRHHGLRHAAHNDVINDDDEEAVVIVHDVRQAVRQLELAPLAADKVFGEDHHDLLAALHIAGDVVHDLLARYEVALVDAQPEPLAVLQLRHEVLTDPAMVERVVRHEDVKVEMLLRQSLPEALASTPERLKTQQPEIPAVREQEQRGKEREDHECKGADNQNADFPLHQTRLLRNLDCSDIDVLHSRFKIIYVPADVRMVRIMKDARFCQQTLP
jgi:hypothetical protein